MTVPRHRVVNAGYLLHKEGPFMGWILLFVISLVLIFGFIITIFSVSSESDEKVGDSNLTKNQVRALAWVIGVVICIAAALIEYVIVVKDSGEEDQNSSHIEELHYSDDRFSDWIYPV